MAWATKFQPIKPRSRHINGKIKRWQRTDLKQLWSSVDLADANIEERLDEQQTFYIQQRPHSSLNRKTPMERACELLWETPLSEVIEVPYVPHQGKIREKNDVAGLEV